jgi:antitoxin MazE
VRDNRDVAVRLIAQRDATARREFRSVVSIHVALGSRLAGRSGCDYNVITMPTKTRIVRIGNSQGIRVPRALLEQAELPEEVELQAQPGRLIVRAARRPRAGWADAARVMHERGHDALLDPATPTRFERDAWTW